MSVGRPTEYTPEMLEKAANYLHLASQEDQLPQVAGLALFLGVSRKTLYNWADQHDDFLHIFEEILAAQERTLIMNGLKGTYNSTITKLMLTKHGYHDKQETDITSGGDKLTVQPIMYATSNTVEIPATPASTQSTESTG